MRIKNGKLNALSIIAIAITLAVAPAAALAQASTVTSNSSFPADSISVSCAGDIVNITGDMHVVSHVTLNSSGGRTVDLQTNTQEVKGQGLSGASYTTNTILHDTFNEESSGTTVHTMTEEFLLIGQGQTANLIVKFTMHVTVNSNGEVTAAGDNFIIRCLI